MHFAADTAMSGVVVDFTYTHFKERHNIILLMFQGVGSRTIYDLVKKPTDRNASTLIFMSLCHLDHSQLCNSRISLLC